MIPDLVAIGGVWKVLPPGVHKASLDEVKSVFGDSGRRSELYDGFAKGCSSLYTAGCNTVYLDGSFVTSKPEPGDFDACWDSRGVDPNMLDPVLLDFRNKRASQKAKYGGEFFIATDPAAPGIRFLSFFQTDRYTGKKKGILKIRLDAN